MCTLTWWRGRDGYEVFFNRDERLTRPEAFPPMVSEEDGVKFVAPIDSPSGGTWLAVNEHGLTLAILNYYEREEPSPPVGMFRSRGQLVRSLAGCRRLEEAAGRLAAIDRAHWNAFSLVGFDEGPGSAPGGLRVWRWVHDGEKLSGPEENPGMPVCSSSFDPERIVAARKRIFEILREEAGDAGGPDWLDRFHHWDGGGHPSAETVLMQRPDARTWSISRVQVGQERVRFAYEALSAGTPAVTCELERR